VTVIDLRGLPRRRALECLPTWMLPFIEPFDYPTFAGGGCALYRIPGEKKRGR
jgi:hypothetical protein